MTRDQVKAGLRAYKHIGSMIESKRTFAAEAGDDEAAESYLREAERLGAVRQQIIAGLNRLDALQMDVVWRQYIKGEYWVYIARKHHYSERQIFRIGEAGLDALGSIMEEYPEAADFCRAQEKATL